MQLSTLAVILAGTAGVIADLHNYAFCTSKIQPIGNPNSCPKKRDTSANEPVIKLSARAYGDNAAATRKACAAYKKRNTGGNMWDRCPDCSIGIRHTSDPTYCAVACNSAAGHIGGDEWKFYCKQAGADDSDAY